MTGTALFGMQRALLFQAAVSPGAEVQQLVLTLPRTVEPETIRRAFEVVAARHVMLRTTLSLDGAQTHPTTVVSLERVSYEAPVAEALPDFLASDRARSLDPARLPVFRLTALEGFDGHAVVWTFHHAHLDGRSIEVVLDEVIALVHGRELTDEPPDPALHAVATLDPEVARRGRTYFARELGDVVEATPMPLGPSRGVTEARDTSARIAAATLLPLATLGERFGFTWATVMHAAWALTLAQRANRRDVVFGSTRACRHVTPSSTNTVGCLINTVPFFVELDVEERVVELLARLRDVSLELRGVETVSLTDAASVTTLRNAGDLVRTVLVCEGHTLSERMAARHPELGDAWSFELHQRSGAPLTLAVYRRRDGSADVVLETDSSVLDASEAPRLAAAFVAWVEALGRQPFARLREVAAPGTPVVLVGAPPPTPRSVAALLGEVFEMHAEKLAAFDATRRSSLTYGELSWRANGLAGALRARGAAPGDVVAVSAEHGLDTLIAYVATQLAGFVYVPVDPRHPLERRRFLLEDSGARFWVARDAATDTGLVHVSPDAAAPFRPLALGPETVAYQIYTSGSTGTPKGVRVDQAASSAHARAAVEAFELTSNDRVLQLASPSFDVFFEEVLPTWLAGGCVVVRRDSTLDSFDTWLAGVRDLGITVLQLPTALFHEWAERGDVSLPKPVRLVVLGGEKLNASACRRFRRAEPTVRLVNAYGPTEVTVTSMFADVPPADRGDVPDPVPIGRPFGACEAFVADWRGLPAVEGVRGELCLAGPQVALGYHERPALTASAFPNDPRGGKGRIYRTGDLARIRDGVAYFDGRKDSQVKIRGFRIEPGEVERAIGHDPEVAQVVVKAVTVGDSSALAAFVVPRSPAVTADAIRARVARTLPAALVPQHVVLLSALPRTPGGKVDRESLVLDASARRGVDLTDATSTERAIVEVFSEVLGVDVGLDDDFFHAGGDSLRALRAVALLTATLDATPTVATLIARGTARSLAAWVQDRSPGSSSADAIVELNRFPNGRTPLYGVVGLHLYTSIARAMNRPVFGVYLDEEVAFPDLSLRVPALAGRYLEVIERHTGQPPKLLVGFSFGALVAFEMAHQLDARGCRPDLVVMLDPRLPHMLERRPLDPVRDLVAVARRDRAAAAAHLRGLVGTKIERTIARFVPPPETPTETDTRMDRDRAYQRALELYERDVRYYPGRALIYLARDEFMARLPEVETTWRGLVGPESRVEVVPGTHGDLLREPFVEEINRPLAYVLRRRSSVEFRAVREDG